MFIERGKNVLQTLFGPFSWLNIYIHRYSDIISCLRFLKSAWILHPFLNSEHNTRIIVISTVYSFSDLHILYFCCSLLHIYRTRRLSTLSMIVGSADYGWDERIYWWTELHCWTAWRGNNPRRCHWQPHLWASFGEWIYSLYRVV